MPPETCKRCGYFGYSVGPLGFCKTCSRTVEAEEAEQSLGRVTANLRAFMNNFERIHTKAISSEDGMKIFEKIIQQIPHRTQEFNDLITLWPLMSTRYPDVHQETLTYIKQKFQREQDKIHNRISTERMPYRKWSISKLPSPLGG